MVRITSCVALAILVSLVTSMPAAGHHAGQAQFDVTRTIVLTGIATKMEWINPHAYLHLDVTDENGKVTAWQLETAGPQALRKAGLSRGPTGIKVGDTYTVGGFPARDGSNMALMAALKMPDGRIVRINSFSELGLPKEFESKDLGVK